MNDRTRLALPCRLPAACLPSCWARLPLRSGIDDVLVQMETKAKRKPSRSMAKQAGGRDAHATVPPILLPPAVCLCLTCMVWYYLRWPWRCNVVYMYETGERADVQAVARKIGMRGRHHMHAPRRPIVASSSAGCGGVLDEASCIWTRMDC